MCAQRHGHAEGKGEAKCEQGAEQAAGHTTRGVWSHLQRGIGTRPGAGSASATTASPGQPAGTAPGIVAFVDSAPAANKAVAARVTNIMRDISEGVVTEEQNNCQILGGTGLGSRAGSRSTIAGLGRECSTATLAGGGKGDGGEGLGACGHLGFLKVPIFSLKGAGGIASEGVEGEAMALAG